MNPERWLDENLSRIATSLPIEARGIAGLRSALERAFYAGLYAARAPLREDTLRRILRQTGMP